MFTICCVVSIGFSQNMQITNVDFPDAVVVDADEILCGYPVLVEWQGGVPPYSYHVQRENGFLDITLAESDLFVYLTPVS